MIIFGNWSASFYLTKNLLKNKKLFYIQIKNMILNHFVGGGQKNSMFP